MSKPTACEVCAQRLPACATARQDNLRRAIDAEVALANAKLELKKERRKPSAGEGAGTALVVGGALLAGYALLRGEGADVPLVIAGGGVAALGVAMVLRW